jgi:hypothetical protein
MLEYPLYICDNTHKWKLNDKLEIIRQIDDTNVVSILQKIKTPNEQIKLNVVFPEIIRSVYSYEFSVSSSKVTIFANCITKILTKVSPAHAIFVYNCIKTEVNEIMNSIYEKNNYILRIVGNCNENNNSAFHANEFITEYHILREFMQKYEKKYHELSLLEIAQNIKKTKIKKNTIINTPPQYSPFVKYTQCIYCNSKNSIVICRQCCISEFICIDCWKTNVDASCAICRKQINDLKSHICIVSNCCILPYSVNTIKMKAAISHNAKIISQNNTVQSYLAEFDRHLTQKNNKLVFEYENIKIV